MRVGVIRKGMFAAVFATLVLAGPAWAQNREKAWEVAPELGWVFFGKARLGDSHSDRTFPVPPQRIVERVDSSIDDSMNYGFRFGYHWTKKQMIEFGFSGTATNGSTVLRKQVFDTTAPPTNPPVTDTTLQENLSVDLIVAHINYVYNFFLTHRGRIVPFVTGGVGIVNSSIFGQTADPDMQPILDALVGDENVFMYNYGGGIRFFGSEKAGFRIDARQVRYDSRKRGNQDQIEVGFALTLILGGA